MQKYRDMSVTTPPSCVLTGHCGGWQVRSAAEEYHAEFAAKESTIATLTTEAESARSHMQAEIDKLRSDMEVCLDPPLRCEPAGARYSVCRKRPCDHMYWQCSVLLAWLGMSVQLACMVGWWPVTWCWCWFQSKDEPMCVHILHDRSSFICSMKLAMQ